MPSRFLRIVLLAAPLIASGVWGQEPAPSRRPALTDLYYFAKQTGGGCALKAWRLSAGPARAVATLDDCPISVGRLWLSRPDREQDILLAVGPQRITRFELGSDGHIAVRDTAAIPAAWLPVKVETTVFTVGILRDTSNLAAVTTVASGPECHFEYHEYVAGRWQLRARPSKACTYGDFGHPRFEWESDFRQAGGASAPGDMSVLESQLASKRLFSSRYLVGGGLATREAPDVFRPVTAVTKEDDAERGDAWYYWEFSFDRAPVFLFYRLSAVDTVSLVDVYLQPAGSTRAQRIGGDGAEADIVDRYVRSGSTVYDMTTGRVAVTEPTLHPFWR